MATAGDAAPVALWARMSVPYRRRFCRSLARLWACGPPYDQFVRVWPPNADRACFRCAQDACVGQISRNGRLMDLVARAQPDEDGFAVIDVYCHRHRAERRCDVSLADVLAMLGSGRVCCSYDADHWYMALDAVASDAVEAGATVETHATITTHAVHDPVLAMWKRAARVSKPDTLIMPPRDDWETNACAWAHGRMRAFADDENQRAREA